MADEKLYGPRRVKNLYPHDPNWAKAVDALWRVYYGLYTEKYKKYEEKDELGELIDPWLKNKISKDISYGLGIGQDHDIAGNRSFAFGQGGVTKSFMEIVLGAYNIIPEGQNAEEWIPTDLLLTLGNGPDKDHRSNVFEILKNGFFKFLNGIKIGEWNPQDPDYPTPNGTLQWTPEKGLEIWDVDHWKPLGGTTIIDDRDNITNIIQNTFYFETTTQQFITYINNEWVTLDQEPETIYPESENETAAGKHTHKFEPGKLVNQTAHGFTFGACIKRDGQGNWITSKADTRANAGTVGIVCEIIDADHFRYITGGLLPGDFVDGADYWLSTTTAGAIFIQTDPEVWEIGNVREFIGTGTPNGLEIEIDLGDEISESFFDNPIEWQSFEFRDVVAGTLAVYDVDPDVSVLYRILSVELSTDDGSLLNVLVRINATPVTGLGAIDVQTSKTYATATALNEPAVHDTVQLVIGTGYTGSPSLIKGKFNYRRL